MDTENIIKRINFLLCVLLEGKDDENKLISEIDDLAKKHRYFCRIISEIIVKSFTSEPSPERKVKLMNVIDSLFKTAGQDYIDQFSPILYDLFKTVYLQSSETNKIQLYKIFYTWKYLIESKLLEQLNNELNLNLMKELMKQRFPGIFERYDQYNENLKQKIMEINLSQNNIVKIRNKNNNNKEKVGLSDDLFSDSSPSFSADDNNQQDRYSNHSGNSHERCERNEKNGIKNQRMFPKKQFKESEEDKDYLEDEKTKNMSKMIKKIREQKKMKEKLLQSQMNNNNNPRDFLNHKRSSSPLSQKYKDNNNQHLPHNSNINAINGQILQGIKAAQSNSNVNVNQNTNYIQNSQLNQQYLLKLFSQKIQPNTQNVNKSNQMFNQSLQNNTLSNLKFNLSPTKVELFLSQFIKESHFRPKTSFPFFSSIAKFFTETYKQSRLLPTTKTNNELFKAKDLFESVHNYTYHSLFTNLRNVCAVCGYRNIIYSKFVEHLDIHFHYNYLKHTSKNKVLCRKEGCDKQSWITGSYLKVQKAYTLNAILYYKNDSDHLASGPVYKAKEVKENNEELIYPVNDLNDNVVCAYCGDGFKKKYFDKHHYWFYVNVVKVKGNPNKESELVHESCVEEYGMMLNSDISTQDSKDESNK